MTTHAYTHTHQVAEMEGRVVELQNKARYCTMIHDGELSVVRKTVAQVL